MLARTVAWDATPIGPPAAWPPALRSAVEMCLSTRFPVVVTWGPALTMIYNDGYREMLGADLHPGALGASFPQVWAGVWDDIGPLIDHALVDGEPTWVENQRLTITRNGFAEETFFTYSFSPLRDASETICGVLDIATETTGLVVERRRTELLGRLTSRLAETRGGLSCMANATVEVLRGAPDVALAEIHGWNDDGVLLPLASTGADGGRERDPAVTDVIVYAVAKGNTVWEGERTVVMPLWSHPDSASAGALVLQLGDERPWDAGARSFLTLVGTVVTTAMNATRRHRIEVDSLREISDVLQTAILPAGADQPGVSARYLPATGGLAVGGDWYDIIALGDHHYGIVVGDCVGHGLDAAARMGQLRSAGRALLLEGAGPAAALDGLDRFAATLPGAEFATVVCAVVDEAAMTLTYAAAGHLPPVLVGAGGDTRWLDGGRSPSLVLGSPPRTESVTTVQNGDMVVLYTDGLVERRDEALPVGLERLRELVGVDAGAVTPDGLADALLTALVPRGGADDVAVVVYQVGARGPKVSAQRPATAGSAPWSSP